MSIHFRYRFWTDLGSFWGPNLASFSSYGLWLFANAKVHAQCILHILHFKDQQNRQGCRVRRKGEGDEACVAMAWVRVIWCLVGGLNTVCLIRETVKLPICLSVKFYLMFTQNWACGKLSFIRCHHLKTYCLYHKWIISNVQSASNWRGLQLTAYKR